MQPWACPPTSRTVSIGTFMFRRSLSASNILNTSQPSCFAYLMKALTTSSGKFQYATMFMARSSICRGVSGRCCLSVFSLSHGSSFRYLMGTSNVAPPHTSIDQKPTWFSLSQIGSMSSILILVAKTDWCASLNICSCNCTIQTPSEFVVMGQY